MRTILGSTKDKDEFGGAVARRRVGVGRIRPRLLAAPSERTGLTQAPRTCLLPAQSAGNTEGALRGVRENVGNGSGFESHGRQLKRTADLGIHVPYS